MPPRAWSWSRNEPLLSEEFQKMPPIPTFKILEMSPLLLFDFVV
jgi:hypothetical protein